MLQNIQNRNIKNMHIINCGAWNKNEMLHFLMANFGSKVNNNGDLSVEGRMIDSIVKDKKVSFIKMDIEGAELKALVGARKTIMRNKPRLAISIYHKSDDIFRIPDYIIDLDPSYKFYIRHYASTVHETVLYAI